MVTGSKIRGMGWLPDYPDIKDYTEEHDPVTPRLKQLGQRESVRAMLRKTAPRTISRNPPTGPRI